MRCRARACHDRRAPCGSHRREKAPLRRRILFAPRSGEAQSRLPQGPRATPGCARPLARCDRRRTADRGRPAQGRRGDPRRHPRLGRGEDIGARAGDRARVGEICRRQALLDPRVTIALPPTAVAPYRAPRWLVGGHAQTIWPVFVPRPEVHLPARARRHAGRRFLGSSTGSTRRRGRDAPLVVLFHGLEGSSRFALRAGADGSSCARSAGAASSRIFAAAAASRTACRAPITRATTRRSARCSPRSARALRRRRRSTPSASRSAAARCSTGSAAQGRARRARARGGRRGVDAARPDRRGHRDRARASTAIYTRHFLRTLKPKALAMARRFPGLLDADARSAACDSMYAFDDAVTAPLHGFAGTARLLDARDRASRGCASVAVPTLVLNATQRSVHPGALAARRGAK